MGLRSRARGDRYKIWLIKILRRPRDDLLGTLQNCDGDGNGNVKKQWV